MSRHRLLVLSAIAALLSSCQPDSVSAPPEPVGELAQPLAQSIPPGFQEELFLSGRTEPTAIRFTADDQVMVAEKGGRIYAYGSYQAPGSGQLVIDLNTAVHNFWDRGLLGMAIHPQFPSQPYVYVLYTLDSFDDGTIPRWGTGNYSDNCPSPPGPTDQGCVVYGRLSRIAVDPTTMVGVEEPLLTGNWCQQYPSHSVGDLAFGEDGMLYLTSGDGADFNRADWGQFGNPCADPSNEGGALRSQDILTPGDATAFNGSLLRLDVSGGGVAAPTDNPLVGNGVADDDFIVANGLRNPFRITTRPGTDEVWIADVGWNTWEEINRVESFDTVKNFGWPCYEGSPQQGSYSSRAMCQQLYSSPPGWMEVRSPYYAYQHSALVVPGDGCGTGSSSVTGVAFNAASVYPPEYDNALFFADSSRRCVWTMFAGGSGLPDPSQRAAFVTKSSGRVVDIQMGPDGFLYYVDFDGGNIYRIAYYPANVPPQAQLTAAPTSGPVPLFVQFDASASVDSEDGTALSYAWDLDNDGQFDDGTGPLASTTFTTPGNHVVRVQVTDSADATDIASVTITGDNSPPVPVILTPDPGYEWSVGDAIAFSGEATDAETGPVPASQLNWQVILHHCYDLDDCHEHSITAYPGVASGVFDAVDHEYPSYLEFRLTASDAVAEDWALPAWNKRLPLTVTGSYPGGTLSDVPVRVHLDPTRINYASVAPGGADLRVVTASGELLDFEIDNWNPGGTSDLWVKLPTLASASGAQLYVYYDNPAASADTSAPNTWSNGYVGVWHMSAGLADSTDGTSNGTAQGATPSVGTVGSAFTFNGTSDYIDVGNASELDVTGDLSIEAWFRSGNGSRDNYDRLLSKKDAWDAAGGFNLEVQPALGYLGALGGGGDYLRATGVSYGTSWHHVGSTINGTSGSLFVDGVNVTTDGAVGAVVSSTLSLNIGRRAGGGDYFLGDIDEIRLSNVSRPAAWFAAQDASLRDALFSYGTTEQPTVLSATTNLILMPKTVDVEVESVPPGLTLSVGAELEVTPTTKTAINNGGLSISAPLTQMLGGQQYTFSNWSDGGDADHSIVVAEGMAPLVATYVPSGTSTCGDGTCDASETCSTCSEDCGVCPPVCGDGTCDASETCGTCSADCGACPLPSAAWLEAESGAFSGSPTFQIVADGSVSGGQYIQPTSNDLSSPGPNRATYTVTVAAGSYALWGRVRAPTADDDSFWVSVDGGSFVRWNDIPHATTYVWDRVRNSDAGSAAVTYSLSAGTHTIVVANREDGVRLDKLYLTSLGDTPSGLGGSPGTCDDGIQNQTETGIDCGGPCPACPVVCGDGSCDASETCDSCALDCGECPTCGDGIQNGDETGIDCGGSVCPACSALWIQAESGALSGNPTFQVLADSAASGTVITPTSNDLSSPGPNRSSYSFTVSGGTYVLWGRVRAPSADDDSFWVSMDGGAFVRWNDIAHSTGYLWDPVRNSDAGGGVVSYTLSPGTHTVVIANREDGVRLDKLYLTPNGDTPSGVGQ